MRVVLMSSAVTYVPGNYGGIVRELLDSSWATSIVGLLLVDNRNPRLALQGLGLMAMGARCIGWELVRNTLLADPKERYAKARGISVHSTADPHSQASEAWLRSLRPDLVLHMRTRCILRPEFLSIPRLGCVNIHHGLLPETRGTLCDLRLLTQGRKAGFSLHCMAPAVDKGDVLLRTEVADAQDCVQDYRAYLQMSEAAEARSALWLLEQVHATDALPPGLPQKGDAPSKWYKNPSARDIKAWRQSGWKL